MTTNFAIEHSLMLYHDDEWVLSFTYYNHGVQPPYGGVKSLSLDDPLVISVDEFQNNLDAGDFFIQNVITAVKYTNPVPNDPVPDSPLSYEISVEETTIDFAFTMGDMEVAAVYSKSTKDITFAIRQAYDVTWRGWLLYHETLKDFMIEIGRSG